MLHLGMDIAKETFEVVLLDGERTLRGSKVQTWKWSVDIHLERWFSIGFPEASRERAPQVSPRTAR